MNIFLMSLVTEGKKKICFCLDSSPTNDNKIFSYEEMRQTQLFI